MQVVLLAVSVVYFFLGTTLEYAKHSDKILVLIVLAYGLFKTGVGIYFIVKGFKDTFGNRRDIEILELHDTTTFLLVAPRFAIFTIFIISLAKWFTRQQLPIVFVSNKPTYLLGSMVRQREHVPNNRFWNPTRRVPLCSFRSPSRFDVLCSPSTFPH
jgi:hypothetical protein